MGLAAARMEVLALRVALIPALVMEMVCCSIAFVDGHLVTLVHLVKLVNAAHALRGEGRGGEGGERGGGGGGEGGGCAHVHVCSREQAHSVVIHQECKNLHVPIILKLVILQVKFFSC